MKIDFHVHSSNYSDCAVSSIEDQIQAAINEGLDAIFITEHMKLFPQEQLDGLNKVHAPFKVYQAIEVTVLDIGYEDFLVIGVHDTAIENRHFTYKDLYKLVEELGGAIILAHPFRFSDVVHPDVYLHPPHAVELLSSNLNEENYDRRLSLAKELKIPVVTNSDSHYDRKTGCYYNTFDDSCTTEDLIVHALKSKKFSAMTLK
ncbi:MULTISPECIES: PHP domain-containing protein [unclassified Fusibacter]|uniref:PHP domain-containing protein n=1 Tax=unclassified Fusibacter TaxID=2624464 RepID=UPI0013E918A5|nr:MULTISPECIES: PHP domain-containing protein [unclassified Fusibacter]MCK8058605.1 PHP domain-containing protein [Fusibacter sp. A2]NPE22625.1 PHP domain-containing protein [Fusibacter sp. A1]